MFGLDDDTAAVYASPGEDPLKKLKDIPPLDTSKLHPDVAGKVKQNDTKFVQAMEGTKGRTEKAVKDLAAKKVSDDQWGKPMQAERNKSRKQVDDAHGAAWDSLIDRGREKPEERTVLGETSIWVKTVAAVCVALIVEAFTTLRDTIGI